MINKSTMFSHKAMINGGKMICLGVMINKSTVFCHKTNVVVCILWDVSPTAVEICLWSSSPVVPRWPTISSESVYSTGWVRSSKQENCKSPDRTVATPRTSSSLPRGKQKSGRSQEGKVVRCWSTAMRYTPTLLMISNVSPIFPTSLH